MLLFRSLLSATILAGTLSVASAQTNPAQTAPAAAFTDAQRQAIEGIIKDYLVKNPDVLQEAIAEGERRQQETQKLAQSAALKESREALVNSPHGVVAGNPAGDVTLVEFFDYNCGYCRKALADIQNLIKGDPKLRVVLRISPCSGRVPGSQQDRARRQAAAQGRSGLRVPHQAPRVEGPGECRAGAGGRQGDGPRRGASDQGCAGTEVKAALAENVGLGDKLGLSGTPAFIVGDEIIPGAVGVEPIRKIIGDVRQCGHAAC